MTAKEIHLVEQESAALSDDVDLALAAVPPRVLGDLLLEASDCPAHDATVWFFAQHYSVQNLILRLACDRIQQYMTRKITEVQQ